MLDIILFVLACMIIFICYRAKQDIHSLNTVINDDDDWEIEPARGEWEEGDMFLEDDDWSDSEDE